MNYNRVAFRYAKALLLSCKDDNDKLEAAHNDMSFINNTFDLSSYKRFLEVMVSEDLKMGDVSINNFTIL